MDYYNTSSTAPAPALCVSVSLFFSSPLHSLGSVHSACAVSVSVSLSVRGTRQWHRASAEFRYRLCFPCSVSPSPSLPLAHALLRGACSLRSPAANTQTHRERTTQGAPPSSHPTGFLLLRRSSTGTLASLSRRAVLKLYSVCTPTVGFDGSWEFEEYGENDC